MQLTAPRRDALIAQACAAVIVATSIFALSRSAHAQPPEASHAGEDTNTKSSTLPTASALDVSASSDVTAYADTDHVYVVTPSIGGSVAKPSAGWSIAGRYLVDVVSAASVDIVSTASRRWEEVRQAGTIDAAYKPGAIGVLASGAVSSEPDYASFAGGVAITQDVFDKRVTWLLGVTYGHDVAGRTGTAFSVFSHPLDKGGAKAALTFVLGPATLLSIGTDVIVESGDPSKVYRYVPMFAPGTSLPRGASIDVVTNARLSDRPLEQLPLSRDRFALSALLAHRFRESTLRIDERMYVDSWGLKATTTDVRYRYDLSRRVEIGPHVRIHAQTSVDFWQRGYVLSPGNDFPALRTGDRELGPLLGITGGARIRIGLGSSAQPKSWIIGFDWNLTHTQFLDDIYITHRLSTIGALTLETEL